MSWTCSAGIFSPTSLKPDPQLTNSQLSVTLFGCAFLSIGNVGFLRRRCLSKQQRLTQNTSEGKQSAMVLAAGVICWLYIWKPDGWINLQNLNDNPILPFAH
ncbi:hypothetical protein MTR67_034958 [Solanum verrucosum]|uniref:Uncharacterized protein n=1 Tax=Solanum verrucosum TaxID=315347 RepID=A0AAF0U8P4_SOLVR|nr:hypothetical protein MTR67_034958 [Solanum verrucosum]